MSIIQKQTFPDIFQGKMLRKGKIKGDLWDGRKEEGKKMEVTA